MAAILNSPTYGWQAGTKLRATIQIKVFSSFNALYLLNYFLHLFNIFIYTYFNTLYVLL